MVLQRNINDKKATNPLTHILSQLIGDQFNEVIILRFCGGGGGIVSTGMGSTYKLKRKQ